MRKINLIGKRYGRLIVLSETSRSRFRQRRFICRCDCGGKATVKLGCLRTGYTKSCGCLRREQAKLNGRKHGLSLGKEYWTWRAMKSRCQNPHNASFKHYGGRGIKVCKRWMKFENFFEDMGNPPARMTIERKNNNGNYCPSNCKWATYSEQARNRSNNRIIRHKGQSRIATEWSEILGISLDTIWGRIQSGYPDSKLLDPLHQGVSLSRL